MVYARARPHGQRGPQFSASAYEALRKLHFRDAPAPVAVRAINRAVLNRLADGRCDNWICVPRPRRAFCAGRSALISDGVGHCARALKESCRVQWWGSAVSGLPTFVKSIAEDRRGVTGNSRLAGLRSTKIKRCEGVRLLEK